MSMPLAIFSFKLTVSAVLIALSENAVVLGGTGDLAPLRPPQLSSIRDSRRAFPLAYTFALKKMTEVLRKNLSAWQRYSGTAISQFPEKLELVMFAQLRMYAISPRGSRFSLLDNLGRVTPTASWSNRAASSVIHAARFRR